MKPAANISKKKAAFINFPFLGVRFLEIMTEFKIRFSPICGHFDQQH